MKTAIVVGASGLVGGELLRLMLRDSRFESVRVFVRASMDITHEKLEEFIVNFDELDNWKKWLKGDVLYSALGTTIRKAGSRDAQYLVDYTYQYNVAKAAAANGIGEYVLVSAAGASDKSKLFYLKMKGELEREVRKLPFETIHIVKPGMLAGGRNEVRGGEQLGATILKALSVIPGLAKLRPIEGVEVARAMINGTFRHVVGIHSYSLQEVKKLAERSLLASTG